MLGSKPKTTVVSNPKDFLPTLAVTYIYKNPTVLRTGVTFIPRSPRSLNRSLNFHTAGMESGHLPKPTPLHSMHYNVNMEMREAKFIFEALEKLASSIASIEERLAELAAIAGESGYTNADYDL